jgi:hypothetical protein
MTAVSSWMMIDALMYGQMVRKPTAHWLSAPPLNTLNQSMRPPPVADCFRISSSVFCSVCQSTPGVGIMEISRLMKTSPTVSRIRVRSSGILKVFAKVASMGIVTTLKRLQRCRPRLQSSPWRSR